MRESIALNHEQPLVHRDIVQDYLDALLQEASFSARLDEAVPVSSAAVAAPVPVAQTEVIAPTASVATATVVTLTANNDVNALKVTDDVSVHEQSRSEKPLPQPRASATGRDIPQWGRQGFAALLFDIAGIKMAAPLHLLGGICQIENNLQHVVAQADWFMGLLRWNNRNLRVVDTARFVMPERIKDNSHQAHYQSVIVLGDSHWALAVDQADESTQLSSADVRWKHLLGTRPWLAGTLLNQLCALVDVESLISLLEEADYSPDNLKEKH